MSRQPIITIDNVSKSFGPHQALRNITLEIERGSFTTLLGPSGCGKTTLMRLIAGFYEPDAGSLYIDGARINGMPAFKRNTPLVFQDYALFPHISVFDNIAYGLKLKKLSRPDIQAKVASMLDMFGLKGLEARYPKQLSGGQQQRVAFARALVTGQNVLLMDEPLSNLDAKMRVEVRNELRELQQRTGITALFVTHDQEEALSMSDRIAVFDKGRIAQVGTPWDIYFKPRSKYVADFVGTANFIDGQVVGAEGSELLVQCREYVFRIVKNTAAAAVGDQVTLVIRPECVTIVPATGDQMAGNSSWKGEIARSSFLGHTIRYWVTCGSQQWIVDDSNPSVLGVMEGAVLLNFDKNSIHLLPAQDEVKAGLALV